MIDANVILKRKIWVDAEKNQNIYRVRIEYKPLEKREGYNRRQNAPQPWIKLQSSSRFC